MRPLYVVSHATLDGLVALSLTHTFATGFSESMRGHIYDSSSFGRLRPRRRVVAKRPTVQLSRINEDDPVFLPDSAACSPLASSRA
ncbi:hypothetical protein BD309DRAFT_957877 [Dichomitus squalens]|nr:hypothetical protein BD309DRAFT_957877 [Dichomitus squalens]